MASFKDPRFFDMRNSFPEADHGSILITSRRANLWRLEFRIELARADELQGESIYNNSMGNLLKVSALQMYACSDII